MAHPRVTSARPKHARPKHARPVHARKAHAARHPRRATLAGVLACALMTSAGCIEERIVSAKGLLIGLPGAESKLPGGARTTPRAAALATPASGIREELEDGTVILHAKSIQHLMTHIVHAIQNDEEDLFAEQILCDQTLEEFRQRRVDPRLGFREVVRRQRDVFKLFNAMPFGESTPGLFLETIGRNEFRLAIPRSGVGDLKWVGIDAVYERGNYRLRWFVNR